MSKIEKTGGEKATPPKTSRATKTDQGNAKAPTASDYTTLADQLRAMVAETGLSTNAVALASGVPQPVLQRFLSGTRENIRLDVADRLCVFFGVRLTAPRRSRPAGNKQERDGK